jgi:hypothetical protein
MAGLDDLTGKRRPPLSGLLHHLIGIRPMNRPFGYRRPMLLSDA